MRRLFFLAALLLLAPLAAQAQVYPAAPNVGLAANRPVNCVASNPGQPQEPQWYFATDTSVLSICVATNTWQNTTGGGGGGGIGGGGTTGFLPEWSNSSTIGNSLCQDLSGVVLVCGESVSVGANAFMISKSNAASGTIQFLAVSWDANRNALTAIPGNSVRGIAGLGAGTSGTVQIAIGGEYPWTCDNQTVVNDWLVLSVTNAGQCHDAGATEPTGVQNIAQVAGANTGPGTATLADIFTPDTVNAPAGPPTVIQVNGAPLASNTGNFNSTTPAAPANSQNVPFATDGLSPSGISAAVPQATAAQAGILQLATDLGGSYTAPNVVGIQGIPCTLNGTPVAGQVWGFTSPTACANLSLGVAQRTYSGATDTILSTDRESWVRPTHSGTVATTLPQAGTTGFTANFTFGTLNFATGTDTITPATSTINGNATLPLLSNWFALTGSDNTNYFAAAMPTAGAFPACADSAGNHLNFTASGGIICGTSSSGGAVSFSAITNGTNTTATMNVGAGASLQPTSTGIITANYVNPLAAVIANDCSGWSSSGSSAIQLQDQGPCGGSIGGAPFGVHDIGTNTTYTIQVGDDKHFITGEPTSAATYTLPQPSSGTAPFVSSVSSTDCSTATTCAVSITVTAGNAIRFVFLCRCEGGSPPPVFSVSDNKSDTYTTTLTPTHVTNGSENFYVAEAVAYTVTGGSTTVTEACSNCAGFSFANQFVYALQYATLTGQDGTFVNNTGSSGVPSVAVTTNFKNDVIMQGSLATFTCADEAPSGFSTRVTAAGGSWPGGGGRSGELTDGVIALPATQNLTLTSACANAWINWAGAFRSTTTLSFLNGFSYLVSNRGTAAITLTPTSSTITTQWQSGASSVSLQPGQSASCMSDGTNWQCVMLQGNQRAIVNTSATNSDVGTTTLLATGAANTFYKVEAEINCTTSTSTAVETLTITYTDTSNTVQTATAQVACSTLGTASIASINLPFRAKASTNIQYGTVHTTAQATYDVSVGVYQLATN